MFYDGHLWDAPYNCMQAHQRQTKHSPPYSNGLSSRFAQSSEWSITES